MTKLDDLIAQQRGSARGSQRVGAYRAQIATSPADLGTKLYVTIPNFDPKLRFGPCRWMPRGATLPTRGDQALVEFDDNGEAWVVAWWPF